jgi:hypothetical protein
MVRTGSDGHVGALLAASAIALAGHSAAAPFAEAIASIRPVLAAPAASGCDLQVLRWWDACLAQPGPPAARAIADALAALRPRLGFVQNPNYVATEPADGFLARYGYAVIAGPRSGPAALVEHPELAFGVLLLGPHTTYPTHVHPASELYLPLGRARWSVRGGPLVERPSGVPIVHRPGEPHETRTAETPLAALYVWLGELGTAARVVEQGLTRP